ncbi:MAG: ATP-binding protein [Firmicutes bacterium]|nr:ATP-binding protein [Bacillota bacterium]
MENYVIRKNYLEKMKRFKEQNLIKVITGIRRSGKSVLMEQFQDYLKEDGVKEEQIISLNFEKLENEELADYKRLHDYIAGKLCKNGWTYIFLDELQIVPEFQKTINSLRTKDKVDIYVTGSNASLLSSELSTLLTGRCITIHVLPLSFKEYVQLKPPVKGNVYPLTYPIGYGEGVTVKERFNTYMKHGAFPQTLRLHSPKDTQDYLDDVFSAIIRKDILARGKSIQENILTKITKFLFHSVGSEVSLLNISNTLSSSLKNNKEISYNTVERYISLLKESFIIYEVNRYDIKGKRHLTQNAKYYAVDTGMRNMLLANKETDTGHLLENIIYLELLRREYKVSVGKVDAKEVDFVCENSKGIEYYQVATSLLDPKTLERELESLNNIKDHFPKFLITLDDYSAGNTYNGIRIINAIDFLLNESF